MSFYAIRQPKEDLEELGIEHMWFTHNKPLKHELKQPPISVPHNPDLFESFATNLKGAITDINVDVFSGDTAFIQMKDFTEYIGAVFFESKNQVVIRRLNSHNVIVPKNEISYCVKIVEMEWFTPDDPVRDDSLNA